MEKINIVRLKKSLDYLESKQRQLYRESENDTRSIESIIKYLKKAMLEEFKLSEYDATIKDKVDYTVAFIKNVQSIIDKHSDPL